MKEELYKLEYVISITDSRIIYHVQNSFIEIFEFVVWLELSSYLFRMMLLAKTNSLIALIYHLIGFVYTNVIRCATSFTLLLFVETSR